ncbi:VOC family protein [Vibrio comitans]|uniref:VOC family protein n=1 Tax=Vibrio comitans TaxID=413401 RepID=UPI0035310370
MAYSKRHRLFSKKIHVTSVPVDDQEKALDLYTNILGFIKKIEAPLGEYKWLTLMD